MTNKIYKFLCIAGAFILNAPAFACTSAIIGAESSSSGRPILWKHRDTSNTDNKIEYIPAQNGCFGYVALYNADDTLLKEAWMGMNETGFAVMNTASYNIKDDNVSENLMDKEGIIMTKALQVCRSVDDFQKLLDDWERPMGVEANFGVIDALGNGAYFETNNHSYVKYDLKDAPHGVLVRTNYSHSGRKNEGYGHIREANAEHLLKPYLDNEKISPELLTEVLSRSFYHDGKKRDFTHSELKSLLDEDFIPRYKSTATVAIEGCIPVERLEEMTPEIVSSEYIMWTGLGYPPVAEIKAVRCCKDGVADDVRGTLPNGHAPLAEKAKQLRDSIFNVKNKKKPHINLSKLYNSVGTGYAQQAILKNKETYKSEKQKRDGR